MWGESSESGEKAPPDSPIEGGNLQDQFQQQRHKIEELKELIKKNEEKLVNREKEVQKYATKLSDIKSRSKASKSKSSAATPKQEAQEQEIETPKMEEGAEDLTPKKSSIKKTHGNLVLLRRKLEENRIKFELRGKEMNENRKGIEEMVQNLKIQLDERDVQIKQLQKAVEGKGSTIVTSEISQDASIPEVSDEPQDVKIQIAQKDNKIIELNKKLLDLETKMLDLQENFREKDSVIAARTKAIALMSEDFSRRNKAAVDNLEETRDEMRKMQKTFIEKEINLNNEIEELKKEVAAKNLRLHQIEESNKELHSVQFDLSTRNAELQEKVVRMQELNVLLQKQVAEQEEKLQDNSELEKLKNQLDEAHKQSTKMKAQHKNKMKNLNKQLDALKKMSDANEEIVKLQNKIAELEEDKGNLQLHLVDFDELKVSESHCQTRVTELEDRVSQQSQDLDSHVHMIALLETEKIDHLKAIQEEKEHIVSLQEEMEKLKTHLSELESQKLSLELKTVDLEEQIDILNKEKKELQSEMETMSVSRDGEGKDGFEKSLEQDNVESIEVPEGEQKHVNLEGELNSSETLNQLEAELQNSRRVIEEQRAIIIDLNSKIDIRDEELELQREMITKLEHLNTEDKEDKIMDIVKDLNEMASDLEEWKRRCSEVEKRLQDLEVEKDELEKRFSEVKVENSTLKQQLENQKDITTDLSARLQEQSNAISNRDDKINSLQGMIELNGQTLEAREMTLKDVHEKLNNVERHFESRLSELKQVLANKEREIQDMSQALSKQKELSKLKGNEVLELTDILNTQKQEILSLRQHAENIASHFQAEFATMSLAITERDQLNTQLQNECLSYKNHIKELSSELSNKIQGVKKLETDTIKELEMKLNISEANLKSRDEEVNTMKTEIESAQCELQEKIVKLREVETRVAELTEKNKKFIANLKAKTVTVKSQEQKLQQFEALIEAKENMIVELSSTNEKLVNQLEVKNASASQEMQDLIERMGALTNELNEERSRIELIGGDLTRASERNSVLEAELKDSQSRMQELASLAEEHSTLTGRIGDLENELYRIQSELRNKDEDLKYLKEERLQLSDQGNQHNTKLQEEEEKIKNLESKLASQNNELLKLRAENLTMLEQLTSSYFSITNENMDRVLQFDEVMELFTEILEKNKQAELAHEAKLQEREAVIEFTEQELAKSKERIQHLEDNLSFVEERRLSLENKAETLNLRLQESDRVKEEVVETEGMLEQRLQMLIASEEGLKKRVGLLSAENEDLTQRVAELIAQNTEARKELMNAECILKDLQKETERLSSFEYSYGQATERIEHLESEMKHRVSECEHRMTEKVQKLQLQIDSLESDLRNMNMELEKVELEKRTLLEKYEKLSDVKLSLEDEIESLNEIIVSYKSENESLKEKVRSTQADKELSERIQFLESELQSKLLIQEEREGLISDLKQKLQILENDQKTRVLTIESLSSSKQELNERIKYLENDLEERIKISDTVFVEKDKALADQQEKIQYLELELMFKPSEASNRNTEVEISQLNTELESMRSILLQKDNEIKSYQKRMLQLQFDTVPHSSDQIPQLQDSNSKLQKLLKEKESQICEINSVLNASSIEIEHFRSKISENECTLDSLRMELQRLQEENMGKDNYIQQILITSQVQDDISSVRNKYEEQLSILKQQNADVYDELLRIKAQQEVSEIVHAAENHVHRIKSESTSQIDGNTRTVTFQEPEYITALEKTETVLGLEYRIKNLEEELQIIRTERDEAFLRLSQVLTEVPQTLESMPSGEQDDIILMIGENVRAVQAAEIVPTETSQEEGNNVNVMHQDSSNVSDTLLAYEPPNWDVSEEEGWDWGSNEARLEEEHIQKQQHTLLFSDPADILNKRIIDLEAHIKDLEIEKEKLSDELRASQVRSGKMLKKLKDLKLKNDNLMKENMELAKKKTSKDFGDLDLAIEEELKIQIDTLEKEIKELKNERESAHVEKCSLLKRIDVLTSANERLIEGKENQDIELEVWKQKSKDLTNQLQSLEWRLGELEANTFEQKEESNFFSWDKQGVTSKSGDHNEIDFFATKPQIVHQSDECENLQVLLNEEQNMRVAAEMHLQELQQRLLDVNTEIELLATENADLKNQVEHLQSQANLVHHNNSNLQSAYSALDEEYQNFKKQLEENTISEETKYRQILNEHVNKIEYLSGENKKLEEQCSNIQKEVENMNELKKQYITLQSEYDNVKEHVIMQNKSLAFADEQKLRLEHEIIQLKCLADTESSSSTADMLSEQLTKISELERELHNKAEEVEMMRQVNENQQLEYARVEQEWNNKMERLRKELEFNAQNLLKQRDLHAMLQKEHEELKDHMNKVIDNRIQEAISSKEQEIKTLKANVAESMSKQQLEDLGNMKQKLDESLQILNIRENDIKELSNRLSMKENQYDDTLNMKDSDIANLRTQLLDIESKMSNLLGQKDQDISNLKTQLEERDFKINELQQLLDEESAQLTELRKIVDYESQLKLSRDKTEGVISQGVLSTIQQENESVSSDDSNLSDPQKELDLALYMLHQRDVRCDELTLELMQLLEERDTLQLRLSNALRLNEELRNVARTSTSSSPVKSVLSEITEKAFSSSSRDESPEHLTTVVTTSLATPTHIEIEEDFQSLANKLSELRSVGYHRDVTLQDEREQRHSEQVRLLHHRGSGIVVDANYTLSRDVQSPSTVLLNWIWGRSTPRVMHI